MIHEKIAEQFNESSRLKTLCAKELAEAMERAFHLLWGAVESGGKILLCGNGGSAADAQHIAAEIVGRYRRERAGAPALALTTDTSILTAVGNDYGFEEVFARQVEALGKAGDCLVGLSTSGQSPNVGKAMERAQQLGLSTVGLLGRGGGPIKELCDVAVIVPSESTPRIQEVHITVGHIWCDLLEERLVERAHESPAASRGSE